MKIFALLLCLFWTHVSFAASGSGAWFIDDGDVKIGAELQDYSLLQVDLLSAQGIPQDKYAKKLVNYYQDLQAGVPTNKILAHLSPIDGSMARAKDIVKAAPSRYEVFKSLEKVMLTAYYQWGEYRVFYVTYIRANSSFDWVQAVECANECFISDLMSNLDGGPASFISQLVNPSLPQTQIDYSDTTFKYYYLPLSSKSGATPPAKIAIALSGADVQPKKIALANKKSDKALSGLSAAQISLFKAVSKIRAFSAEDIQILSKAETTLSSKMPGIFSNDFIFQAYVLNHDSKRHEKIRFSASTMVSFLNEWSFLEFSKAYKLGDSELIVYRYGSENELSATQLALLTPKGQGYVWSTPNTRQSLGLLSHPAIYRLLDGSGEWFGK